MPTRLSYEEVKQSIESMNTHGTILLSTDYENNRTPLLFKCGCGRTFERSYYKFMNGTFTCAECRKQLLAEKYKFSLDDVRKIISESGCEYISGDYKNNQSVLTIRCSCGNVFEKTLLKFRSGQNRCPECGSQNYKGTNSHFYVDGRSSAYTALRESLLKWKEEIRELYDDTCPITGKHGDSCDVHHIVPLRSIYEPIMNDYGMVLRTDTKISDFPDYKSFDDVRRRVFEAHTPNIGILISKDIHYAYHAIYKGDDCSEKTFAKFLLDKYNVRLSKIRR